MKCIYKLSLSIALLALFSACNSGGSSSGPITTDETVITDTNTTIVDTNTTADTNTTIIDTNTSIDTNLSFSDAIVHDDTFTSLHFSGSQNCAQCHDGITDSTGKDVSIVKAWGTSMMANAAIDPLWRAKVASEVKRNPAYKDEIEAKCSKCHTPMATTEANFSADRVSLFDDGFLNPDNPHYNEAINGVSCTLCHQIENTPDLGTSTAFSGSYTIADNTSTARKTYGQYTSPNTTPMQNNVGFTPAFSPHMDESKLCATCHNLETPVIDTEGALTNRHFTEQAVYTEWEYSEFNTTKTCQDCHMPKTEGSVVISTRGGGLQARSPFFQHQFLGANTYMINIIKNNRSTLGSTVPTEAFDQTITNTRDFLMASADINISAAMYSDEKLNFDVIVTNHSGHKFPTSYPSRRAWIHVKVVNNNTHEVVFESGSIDSRGRIFGVDEENESTFQPHHEEISDVTEVQVYETVMADTEEELTYTLMHAAQYLKDNRILPKGFDKENVPESVQTFGEAATDTNFIGGSDLVKYAISLPEAAYSITATLRYQTISYGFSRDLFKDNELYEVALMQALDNNTTNRFETVSESKHTLTLP